MTPEGSGDVVVCYFSYNGSFAVGMREAKLTSNSILFQPNSEIGDLWIGGFSLSRFFFISNPFRAKRRFFVSCQKKTEKSLIKEEALAQMLELLRGSSALFQHRTWKSSRSLFIVTKQKKTAIT